MQRKAGVIAILSVALVSVSAMAAGRQDRLHGEFSRVIAVQEGTALELWNYNGETTVRPGAAGEVRLAARISAGTEWDCDAGDSRRKVAAFAQRHPLETEGRRLRVGHWADETMGHCTVVYYELVVPSSMSVHVRHGHGDVKIYEIAGPVEVEVEGGGAVRIKDPGAGLRVRTGVGSISVDGRPSADWRIDSGLGGIELRVPKDAGFDLDATSDDGRIETEFTDVVRPENRRRAPLRAPVNGGGPAVRIRTESGSIDILQR